ncbi:solute carrier family 4 [Aureococcus anophagefferens]|nr:solute carrier family 4 [Aureococcus anophagefferens]
MAAAPPQKADDGGPPLPTWAPTDESSDAAYSLEMIKNGTSVETVPLTASRFLLGRAADCVAYAMAHASISRVHLVFQRSNDGRLYVADCGSAHGSRLNKAPLPPLKYVEARGGDVLQLGASTRVLAIHAAGQDRAARALLENEDVRLDASGTLARRGRPRADLPEYLKTNRGFMEYGGEINSTLKDGEKHAKDAKLHERLETKLRKLNRCRSDNQRLLSKEGGADGLSDGQKRAFDVNDAQIAKLTDEIADLEETIRGRNAQRETSERRRAGADGDDDGYLYAKQHARESNVDDDHDLRDLTTPLARARTAEEKAERRRRRRGARRHQRRRADRSPTSPSPRPTRPSPTTPSPRSATPSTPRSPPRATPRPAPRDARARRRLDAFMATNDAEAAAARRASARRDAAALETERARLSRLMDVARLRSTASRR